MLAISDRAQALLDEYYPLPLHAVEHNRSVAHAVAGELQLLDDAMAVMEANIAIFSSIEYLPLYEFLVGVPVGGSDGQTLQNRRETVSAYLQRAVLRGQGQEWVKLGRALIGNTWTYSFGGTNNSVLTVTMPYSVTNYKRGLFMKLLESITPASIRVQVVSSTGFLLDESGLDGDLLT